MRAGQRTIKCSPTGVLGYLEGCSPYIIPGTRSVWYRTIGRTKWVLMWVEWYVVLLIYCVHEYYTFIITYILYPIFFSLWNSQQLLLLYSESLELSADFWWFYFLRQSEFACPKLFKKAKLLDRELFFWNVDIGVIFFPTRMVVEFYASCKEIEYQA